MGRGALKYTDEQREAIAQAVNAEGRTGKDVAGAAGDGTLKEGLEPFELPVSTAGEIARQQIEGQDREHNAGVAGGLTLAELAGRGHALLDREFEALEEQKAGELDLHRLQLALRAARELGHRGSPAPERLQRTQRPQATR
jgi:hypothetical protein